jgi:cell division septation protein DedD
MMRGLVILALALVLASPALARKPSRPAELPPPDYQGKQYVDSEGCLFMRAGTPGNVLWQPRVTRDGVPLCGYPPSGKRVPVAEEGGTVAPDMAAPVAEAPVTKAPATEAPAPAAPAIQVTGYFVAVGSFGVAGNAERAAARLLALNYAVAQGRPSGESGLITIYAGPFGSAEEATRAQGELRKLDFPDAVVVQIR